MNIIQEQRQRILKENNTAQTRLKDILEKFNKASRELVLIDPLHGDLDFSILKEYGITNLSKITCTKGEITSVVGLPESVSIFECPDNLLINLENLPSGLTTIEIPHNYLERIDLSSAVKLETIIISDNKLTAVENIPPTLKNLDVASNKLTSLNLVGVLAMENLIVSNNPIALIENMPEGTQVKMENTPSIEFRNSALANETFDEPKKNTRNGHVAESLNEYFRMKTAYEEKYHKQKKRVFEKSESKRQAKKEILTIKPSCIKCKRPVGTVFSNKNGRYSAKCGDVKNPCKLDVQIYIGESNMSLDYILNIFHEDNEEIKNTIIEQKLDTLFNYTSEEESVKNFKKELDNFSSNSKTFKKLLDKRNELFFNMDKKHLIEKKNGEIFHVNERIQILMKEYEKTQNKEILKQAMHMHVKELIPEIRNLRMLKNETMEVNKDESEYVLFQYPVEINKIEHNVGEPMRVIKFER
jgi:hypothetical protein